MKTTEKIVKNIKGYIILPRRFTHKGWDFKQLDRKNKYAIFSKVKYGFTSFEVIEIQNHEAYEIAGNFIEAKEAFPSDEQWGSCAWTFVSEEPARKKFSKLIKK